MENRYTDHPIIGQTFGRPCSSPDGTCVVYTRTVVLWALNVLIDPVKLWENVTVTGADAQSSAMNGGPSLVRWLPPPHPSVCSAEGLPSPCPTISPPFSRSPLSG